MTVSYWQHAYRKEAAAYDVVVVGGGVVGCATAYWLERRKPSLRVAIVDAGPIGAGASGRNAGFVLQGTASDFVTDVKRYGERTARRLWHFTRENRDLIASDLRGSAFGWESNGSLVAAGRPEEEDRLRASLSPLRASGAPVVYLEGDNVNERASASNLYGGLFFTSGGVLNPLDLVHYLAEQSGADLRPNLPVRALRWDEGSGVSLETSSVPLWGRRVVVAVGAALPDLVPALSAYARPVRAQMLATAPADARSLPVPVYSHEGEFYVRQLADGTVLAGGGRHHHRDAEETDVDRTTPAVQATIERCLHTHFPWTQDLPIRHRWSGTMAFSPDGRPVVGTVPGRSDGLFATGLTGHGMGYGVRMGQLLADWLVEGAPPAAHDLFAPSRFDVGPTAGAEAARDSATSNG